MNNNNNHYKALQKKISKKKSLISVIGLGYIGLPLALSFAKNKFNVQGIDKDKEKINFLKKKSSYISTVSKKDFFLAKNKFKASSNFSLISESDIIIVCVPTPIKKNKQPDMSYVNEVVKKIDKYLKKNTLIILECTTYPETSEDYFLPIIKKKKLILGKNIFLGYSPEREDPGNIKYSIAKGNLPKVISGYTNSCLNLVKLLYKSITRKTFSVSNIKTAEFTKLLENIYRSVNIGLVNELSEICKKLNIDIHEAIKAAKTKPFGFTPFYPGPGVGGHCIPTDPYYLSWKAKKYGLATKFIKLAGKINDDRPLKISKEIEKNLKKIKYQFKKKILVLGLTYKKNSDDTRDSPAIKICKSLNKKIQKKLLLCDPLISKYFKEGKGFKFINKNKLKKKNLYSQIKGFKFINIHDIKKENFYSKIDVILLLTNHDIFNYKVLIRSGKHIFDCTNTFNIKNKKVIKLY